MMRIGGLALALLLIAGTAAGQTGVAKYAGEFLAIGVGARPLGMGGAYAALAADVTAGYWNPAGLAQIDYPQAALMHAEQFGSLLNYDYGAVAFPFGPSASLGLSVLRLGVDDIPDTRNAGLDAAGNYTADPNLFTRVDPSKVTYFNAADWAFLFTYARRHDADLSYGGNLKIIRRDLGDFGAWGVGVDVGVWYRAAEFLTVGANLQDALTTLLAWDTGRNELISPTLKLGSAGRFEALDGVFVPALDLDLRFEDRRTASILNVGPVSMDPRAGLEYTFREVVALRVGYNDVKQFTLGAGLLLPKLSIDYSFARFSTGEGRLDDTHRVSLLFTLETDEYRRIAGE
jgi:hypothetical protein